MPALLEVLDLETCPHCGVDHPNLSSVNKDAIPTTSYDGRNSRYWRVYLCKRCGGLVTAASNQESGWVYEFYPRLADIDEAIPEPTRSYLKQAKESLHAPAGSVMLCASAVDSMLKAKSYAKGSLYERINKAAEDHLITREMAQWAHDVRLDANELRHADEKAPLPSSEDAQRCLDFALALGEFLFVLPSRVRRGLESATLKTDEAAAESHKGVSAASDYSLPADLPT
jgi:hypothetical protein